MNDVEKLWKEYHAKLRAFIARRIDDQFAVDDVLHDVFLKMNAKLDSLKEETKLESWLYQITRNAVIDYYRAQKPAAALPEWLAQPEAEPAEQASREIAACLRPMIEQLPAHYREAVVLAELQGLTQQEVSQQQGISLSGAKSRVQRGRALLKEMLLQCCQFELDQRGHLIDYEQKGDSCDSC